MAVVQPHRALRSRDDWQGPPFGLGRLGGSSGLGRLGSWIGVLAVAAAAGWLTIVGVRTLGAAQDIGSSLALARDDSVGPALVVTVVLLFLAERRWPAVARPARAPAHLVDAGYLVLFGLVVLPVLTFVQIGFGAVVDRDASFLVLGRLPALPRAGVVLAILIAMDALNWLAHVANHRSRTLWRLHALHHSQEDMSVLTTFRTHPLVHASYLPAILPALVLGANGAVPGACLVVYGCLVTLPHANLRWRLGPLGRVVVSPAYHRLHHARDLTDPPSTVNFGFVLVCWDQLARRAVFPRKGDSVPVATGIAGRPVPIEQAVPRGPVRVVLAQLAQPFRLGAATGISAVTAAERSRAS